MMPGEADHSWACLGVLVMTGLWFVVLDGCSCFLGRLYPGGRRKHVYQG